MPDLIRQSGKPTQPTQPTQQTSASSQQAAPKVQTLRTIPTEPRYNRTGPSEQKLIEVSDRIGGILRKQDTYDPQNPNIRSAAKRIHLYSAEDPDQEANMLAQLAVSASQDQQSPFFKRYSLSTNNDIIQGLSSLGFDMSGGVTPQWLEENKWLQDYYEYSNDYSQTPKAPTKKSTPLQQAAYLYYQLLKDEENTQNAENEWAQMQKDIAYFADLGYDDDEIIKQIRDRMTLGDYATLAKMQDYASNGLGRPMGLNRAIPYDEDSIYGAIWAARNGGGTGNALIDTIYAGAGIGNGWKYDPQSKAARDPSSASYNPYLTPTFRLPEGYDPDNDDGSWRNDLVLDNGVPKKPNDKFTPAQVRAYEIYQAQEVIENTHKAQEELAQLQEWARKQLENGLSADEIIERLGRDDYNSSSKTVFEATYPTLAKMELYRSRGGYMELSAPVDYTPNSFRAWLENTAGSGSENAEEPAEQAQGGSAPTQEQGGGQSLGEAVIGGALSVINGITKFFGNLSSPETLGEGDADEHLTGDWTNQSAPEESNGQMTDEQMASFMSEWGAMYTPTSKLPTASGFLASAAPGLMTDTGDSAISQIIADGQEEVNTEVSLAEEIVAFRRGELSVDDASDLFKNWYNTLGSTLLGGFTFTNGTYDEGGEYHAGGVDNPLWELGPTAQKALDILGHSELTAQQEAEMVITLSRHYAAANTLGVDLEEFYNQNGTARAEIERYRDDAYQNVRGNVQRYLEGEAAGEIDTNLYMRIMTEANNVDISQQKIDDYYYKQIHNRLASYASEEMSRINGEDFDAWIEGGGVDTEESIENERRMLRITGAKYDADKQLDFDLRLATMCGMTLSDFYKAYPQYRTFDPDNIDVGVSAMLDKGVQRYKQFEDSVAELRQMDYATLEQEYNELYRLYTDPEAFNELVSESIPQENTVAAQNLTPQELAQLAQNGQGLKRDLSFLFDIIPFTVEHGFQSFLLSNLKAIDYWAVDRTDQQLETAARSLYTRSEYNRLVYETIDQIEDPEEQQYWRERADNATDIYELDFNYLQQHIKTLIEDKEQFNAEVEQYIEENGTAFEKEFFEDGSMLVSNGLTMAETAVLDAATGGMARFATTLATYGFTAGAEMGRRVEETTGNRTLGKMAGVVAAVWQAWSEKHDPLNFLGDAEAYTESFFRYGIMRGVRNGTAGKTTSYLSRLGLELLHDPVVVTKLLGKHMLQEGGQELYQALGDEAIRSFFTGTRFHYEIGDAWQEFKGGAILGGVFAAIEAMPESWHGHRDAMRIVESGDYSPRAVGELLNLYGEIYNMRTSELERAYGPQVNVRGGVRFDGDTATVTDTGRFFHQNAVAAQVMRDIADGAMHEVARGDLYNKYSAAERAYNAAYSKRAQMEQLLQDKTAAYNQACTEYLGDGVDTLANPDLANEVTESFKAMQEAQSGLDASLPAVEETFAVYKDAMTAYKAAMDEAFNNVRAAAEATVTKTEMGQYARLQQIRENFNKRTEAAIDQVIGELNIPPEQQADMRNWLSQNFDPFTGRARLNPETLRAEADSMMRSNVLANTRAIIEGTAPVTTEAAPTEATAPGQTAETAQAENDLVDAEIELTQAQEAYDAAIGTDGEEAAAQRLQKAQGQVESAHKRMMDLRDMVAADRAAGGISTKAPVQADAQATPEQVTGYRRRLMEVRDLVNQDRAAGGVTEEAPVQQTAPVQETTAPAYTTEEQPALTPEQQEANTQRIQDILANDAAADAVAQSPEVQQAFNALQDARAKLEQIRAGEAPLHGTEMGRTLLENLKAAQAEVTQAETNLANSILTAAEGIDLTAQPVVENTVQAPAAETAETAEPAAEGTAPATGIPVQTETQEGTAPTGQANAPTVSQTATAPKGARKRGVTVTNGDESAYMTARAYRDMARRWVRVAAADRANAAVANGSAPAATAPTTQHRRLGTGGMYNTQEENAYLASRDTREAAAATGLNVDTLPGRMVPIAAENGKVERSIRNPWMIARRLASRIGYSANMSSETLHAGRTQGVTNNRVGYVAVSAPNAQNMAVLFHEMGHAVGARIGMSGNSHLVDLMDPNFRQMYIDTHQDVQAESFAEFFATYMTDPNKGAGIVGDEFVAQFEQQCKDAGHGIWKAVTEAREDTQTFVTASLQEQMRSNIEYDENADVRTLGLKWRDLIHRFTAGFIDRAESTVRMDNIVRAQTKAEINLANGNSVEGFARRIDFAPDISGQIMTGQMVAPDGRVIGDGFSTTIAEHGVNADNYQDWYDYMILQYSLDRNAAGKDFLERDVEDRQMLIEYYEQRYNGQNGTADFAAARDAFYKAWDTFMQAWMVNNSRRISPQLYNQFVEMYPHFFPIMFVADYDQMAKRTGEAHAKHYAPKYAREGKNPIVDPLQALNNIVGRIVEQGLRDRAMQQFDANYSAAEGFGMFARKMRDTREGQVLLGGANRMSVLENAQRAARDAATAVVESIRNRDHLIDEMGLPPEAISRDIERHTNEYFRDRNSLESMQQVLSFADQLERAFDAGADEAGMVTVYRPDGTSAQYEIYDKSFLNFALGTKGTSQILKVLRPVTRFMSTWTTGKNPLFAAKNALRDFQMSVNRGTWASNYATGAIKWGRAFLDVMISDIGKRTGIEALENFGKFAEYSRMGGGNAEAYDSESRRGLRALRRDFYEGYNTSTAGRALAEGGRFLGRVLTFEHLNGWIESASRYAEYRFGKVGRERGIKGLLGAQRQLTVAEQEQAFQNAQEVTVNFRRGGNSQALAELKAIIPFFGASIQGAANTMRMFTSKTIPTGRKAAMITKTIANTVISTVLSALACKKWLDDDEQDALYYINDTYKTEYYLLPNLAKDIFGDSSLIRIPKGQDPLLYGISGAVWDLFWGPNGTKDDGERGWMIDLEEMGDAIMDVMVPVDLSNYKRLLGSTVAGPVTDLIFNENYYGQEIVPSYMQEMYGENNPSQMYYNTTPETMVALGKLLNVSPLKVQYIAKQYTGFLGQVGLPALRSATGGLGGLFDSVIETARKSLTADPFQSNNVLNRYYSGRDFVQEVVDTAKSAMRTEEGYVFGQLRNMGSRDGQMAIEDANELVRGPIAEAKQAIKEFKEAQNRIGGMQGLTDRERAEMIEHERARMLEVVLNANEAIGAYMDKYTYRNDAARVFDLIFGDEEPYNPAQDR